MKKQFSFMAFAINLVMAFIVSLLVSNFIEINPFLTAIGITAVHLAVTYFVPMREKGMLQQGLLTEVWVSDLAENPVPDNSFIGQSQDLSAYVNSNKSNWAEAGVEPSVHEDYFRTDNGELPVQAINDIPHEAILKIYSTSQTRHNSLIEAELAYDKRSSIIKRHRAALAKEMAKRTAYAWGAVTNDKHNKILNLSASDSVIDALIDMQAFFQDLDVDMDGMNIILTSDHLARIRKEDKKLYKEIKSEKGATLYDFKIFSYSQTPFYTQSGEKKPWGASVEQADKKASIIWHSDEVFRCFGETEMYTTLGHSGYQADMISFAQRALTGKIRGNAPKYFGAIL